MGIFLCRAALDVDGTAQSIQGTGELHQHTIAGGLHDASAVFTKLAINKRAPMRLESSKRALLVGAHQQAVADDIGREYCCQFTNNRHYFRPPFLRRERLANPATARSGISQLAPLSHSAALWPRSRDAAHDDCRR